MVQKGQGNITQNPVKLLQFNNKFFEEKRDKSVSLLDRFTKAIRLVKMFQGEFLIEFYDFTEKLVSKNALN